MNLYHSPSTNSLLSAQSGKHVIISILIPACMKIATIHMRIFIFTNHNIRFLQAVKKFRQNEKSLSLVYSKVYITFLQRNSSEGYIFFRMLHVMN